MAVIAYCALHVYMCTRDDISKENSIIQHITTPLISSTAHKIPRFFWRSESCNKHDHWTISIDKNIKPKCILFYISNNCTFSRNLFTDLLHAHLFSWWLFCGSDDEVFSCVFIPLLVMNRNAMNCGLLYMNSRFV